MRSAILRRVCVAAILVSACAICFGRLTRHPFDILTGPQRGGVNDLTEYFLPLRTYQIENWRRNGQWPTWDANLQCGRPTAGNPQASAHYPPNWLFWLFGTSAIASWLMVLHHLFGGWGMYLLCRRHELHRVAAQTGAVTFLAAPYFVAHTAEGHFPQTCVVAWIPWVLIAYERLRMGKKYSVAVMALALALAFFCGHVQELYYLVVITSIIWVVDLIRQSDEVLPRSDLALRWIGAGVLTVGLVACELAPIWLTSKETTRGQGGLTAAAVGGAEFSNLRQLVCPLALGTPDVLHDEHGQYYWETLLSFGAMPLVLAIAALALAPKSSLTIRYGLIVLFCLLFALGDATPFYPLLHKFLPGVSTFRMPARIMFIASAAVAVLAAIAIDRLMRLGKPGSTLAKVMPAVTTLLGVAVAIELCGYAWAVTRTIPPDGYRTNSSLMARLIDTSHEHRVLTSQDLLSDDEAYHHNIAKVRGYDPFYLLRHRLMLQAMFGNRQFVVDELPGYAINEQLSYSPGPLSLMGVRYAVLPSDEPVASEHWKLVDTGEIEPRVTLRGADATTNTPQPYSLYEFASPMPRAFVIGHTEIAYSGEAMIGQLSQIDPREVVIVVEDPWPEGDQQDFQPAEIVELSPTRAVINAELDANGFLVLAENYAKGWKATVNGKPAKVVPVYIGFRGVALSPGKHRVEFHYEPPLCNVGLILTAISLAVVGLLLWNEFRPLPAGDSSDDGAGDG